MVLALERREDRYCSSSNKITPFFYSLIIMAKLKMPLIIVDFIPRLFFLVDFGGGGVGRRVLTADCIFVLFICVVLRTFCTTTFPTMLA
jgi:hypothetical protein